METDVVECIKHINDSLRIDDNTIFYMQVEKM